MPAEQPGSPAVDIRSERHVQFAGLNHIHDFGWLSQRFQQQMPRAKGLRQLACLVQGRFRGVLLRGERGMQGGVQGNRPDRLRRILLVHFDDQPERKGVASLQPGAAILTK